ncbi:MAG TPA: hypothetical protein VK465_09400 [Fibrobacteria bacterium]|nr:hypothetical protein [Fibrobacteria bacterium]
MDYPPQHNDPILEDLQEMKQKGRRSLFNGFKLMSPYQQDAIQQTKEIFPRNFHDAQDPVHRKEQSVIFHERGKDRLVPGPIKVGKAGSASRPEGMSSKTARIRVHSRTYSAEGKYNFEPSMADQITARRYPNIDHVVQVPSLRGEESQYFIYSGKFPPRHYRLLPNPDNLPVSPSSPDGRMSAFLQRPGEGILEGIPSIPWTRNALEEPSNNLLTDK